MKSHKISKEEENTEKKIEENVWEDVEAKIEKEVITEEKKEEKEGEEENVLQETQEKETDEKESEQNESIVDLETQEQEYYEEESSWLWRRIVALLIPLITILVLWVVIGLNFDNILWFILGDDADSQEQNDYYIGKELTVTGLLESASDYRVYTHSLMTQDHDTFGLRSASINLGLYEWRATVRGVVEEYYAGKYVIEVASAVESERVWELYTGDAMTWSFLEENNSMDGNVIDVSLDPSALYFPDAGVLFDVVGDRSYIAKKAESGRLVLESLDDGTNDVAVNYFRCKAGDPNHDCAALRERFASASEFSVSSANGDTYHKLPEADAWFVSNADMFGYFINGASSEQIQELTKYIVLPNKQYISDRVVPHAPQLCSSVEVSLTMVDTFSVEMKENSMLVAIKWSDASWEKSIDCDLSLDLLDNLWASLLSLRVNGQKVRASSEGEKKNTIDHFEMIGEAEETVDDVSWDENSWEWEKKVKSFADYDGEQFPINLEKTYEFASSRGHTIVFPSRNIAFAPGEEKRSVNIDGVGCYSYTNVASFPEQDVLHEQTKMRIYECTISDDVYDYQWYRYLQSEDGKKFLLEAVDPAWQSFVDNMEIR